MEFRDESPMADLAHPNFFTFYKAKGVKGRLFSIISSHTIWAVGVQLSGSLWWGHFSASSISGIFDPKRNNHQNPGEDLPGYPFLPLEKASGIPKANLAHPNFVNYSAQT